MPREIRTLGITLLICWITSLYVSGETGSIYGRLRKRLQGSKKATVEGSPALTASSLCGKKALGARHLRLLGLDL